MGRMVKAVIRANGFMPKAPGFSFIELVVVILIIGIIATIVVPASRKKHAQRVDFIGQLNYLLQVSWQDAVVTGKMHRLVFDASQRKVLAEVAIDTPSHGTPKAFRSLGDKYYQAAVDWDPNQLVLIDVQAGQQPVGRKAEQTAPTILIYPDGLAQPAHLNFSDTQGNFSLVLNPFTAQLAEQHEPVTASH